MHFFYLDETGCTGRDLECRAQPVFVLGGISVRDEGWNTTQEAFMRIIRDYFEGRIPDEFELHAGDLLSPEGDGFFRGHSRIKRNALVKALLRLLVDRKHDVHIFGIDKRKLLETTPPGGINYDLHAPYLLAYDYLITYINWFVKERLGRSARGLIILDIKNEFQQEIERITYNRRFAGAVAHRIKWVVEFSYPVDSRKNPMVQLSDLVIYCARRFYEIENGYREGWPQEAKTFYAECYLIIHNLVARKQLVERPGRELHNLNQLLSTIRAQPIGQWKRRYAIV